MKRLEKFRLSQSWWLKTLFLYTVLFWLADTGINAGVTVQIPALSVNRSKLNLDIPPYSVNHSNLNFGAVKAGNSTASVTGPQQLVISKSGGNVLDWSIQSNDPWIYFYPASGTNTGTVTVSVGPCGLAAGSYTGTVKVVSPGASNSPQIVTVSLNVLEQSQDQAPFGSFDTPINNSTVQSSVPVTGWVLDDVGVNNVKIYTGSQYLGDAVFVEGARPDIDQANPTYPNQYKAGWGYMLLTNLLPGGGNGTYTLSAIATDSTGHQTNLGSKTINCDNAHAVKPFGAIDTPSQSGTASGREYMNRGWVLTPQPNSIPTNGSTISVYVDGVNIGHPTYNIYRMDIAELFPGYSNSNGATGYLFLNTTNYANGVHTIQWSATDTAGNTDGIGSRYFSINNSAVNLIQSNSAHNDTNEINLIHARTFFNEIPTDYTVPVQYRTGYDNSSPLTDITPDTTGAMNISIRETDRIEVHLNETGFTGYNNTIDTAGPLPIGSTIDTSGTFHWIPGPGFKGTFELVFIREQVSKTKKVLKVNILPKQAPLPRMKANGQEGMIRVSSGTAVSINLSLNLSNFASQRADWWVVAYTPSGQLMYFDLNRWTYVAGLATTHQGVLFDINNATLTNLNNLSTGTHIFFFGVDLNENGLLDMDQLYYGVVSVVVTE